MRSLPRAQGHLETCGNPLIRDCKAMLDDVGAILKLESYTWSLLAEVMDGERSSPVQFYQPCRCG